MYAKNHLETMRKYAQEKEARKVGAHYMYQALERWLEAVVLQRTPEATKPLIREIYHQVCLHTGYYQHIWGDIADELRYLEGEDLGLKIRVLLHQESYAQAYDECFNRHELADPPMKPVFDDLLAMLPEWRSFFDDLRQQTVIHLRQLEQERAKKHATTTL